ncbi:MAG: response regulator [Thermodesulfovibrionales bacterium]
MKKILVVEDNQSNLELFLDILSMKPYDCMASSNGEEAIQKAISENPDLILLDIQLPGLDGVEVIKRLRQDPKTQKTKIIALTAHAMKGDRDYYLSQGFDGYISKPIVVKDFLKEISNLLDEP